MDNNLVIDFLVRVPILQRLPSSSVIKIAEVVQFKHYKSGEYVAREGEIGDGIYFIWEGEAKVGGPVDEIDRETRADLKLEQYDCFGHGILASVYPADVIALTKLTCLALPHAYRILAQPNSNWNADENQEKSLVVEHVLQLDPIDVNIFRVYTLPDAPNFGTVFGGQLVGQALAAASKTVDSLKFVHSLHCYFLVAGDLGKPIIYQVHRVGDGNSFASRRIEASQNGKLIFILLASFHREGKGFEHQAVTMPSVPAPETLLPLEVLKERRLFDPRISRDYRNMMATRKLAPWPVDLRFCEPHHYTDQNKTPPSLRFWIKVMGRLSDDMALHRSAVAYISDLVFNRVSVNPHGEKDLKIASLSLDHSMWFHRPVRADDWLLCVIESPTSSNGRGLVSGHMFNRKGELVVTYTQEGMIRKVRTSTKARTSSTPVSQSKI